LTKQFLNAGLFDDRRLLKWHNILCISIAYIKVQIQWLLTSSSILKQTLLRFYTKSLALEFNRLACLILSEIHTLVTFNTSRLVSYLSWSSRLDLVLFDRKRHNWQTIISALKSSFCEKQACPFSWKVVLKVVKVVLKHLQSFAEINRLFYLLHLRVV
jgi:hypothetical protein